MAWETKLRPRHGSLQLSLPMCVFLGTFVVSTVLGELAGRERGLEARGNLALLLWRSQAKMWTLTLERTIVGAIDGGGVGLPEPEAKQPLLMALLLKGVLLCPTTPPGADLKCLES